MAFLNRGRRFEPVVLPREAQWAPVFAVVVADFNGDGQEDLFLSQNFFDVQAENPRQDAGRGLLLLGAGSGQLQPIPGQTSGVMVYGEQRAAAVADYDQDGRVDSWSPRITPRPNCSTIRAPSAGSAFSSAARVGILPASARASVCCSENGPVQPGRFGREAAIGDKTAAPVS